VSADTSSSRKGAVADTVVHVEGLNCALDTAEGLVTLVDDVSFALGRGQTLGIVGESGSGKTMLVRTITGIQPQRAVVSGRVELDGVDLATLDKKTRRRHLGAKVGMVFQNPMTSLNPVVPVGRQITEGLRYHQSVGRKEARERAIALLDQVGIPDPASRLKQYPFQLSGGMRQRVTIAAALACDPAVLIADEATTALDVTVQKQILDLIRQIQRDRDMAVIIISHDLAVVAGRTDHLAVMYGGRVVESGPTDQLFARPRHQYTTALLGSVPELDSVPHTRLATIPGTPRPPAPGQVGCPFVARCVAAVDECRDVDPPREFDEASSTHWFRCHRPRDPGAAALSPGSHEVKAVLS